MKKTILILSLSLFIFSGQQVFATSGGSITSDPENLRYNSANESIYYLSSHPQGEGCGGVFVQNELILETGKVENPQCQDFPVYDYGEEEWSDHVDDVKKRFEEVLSGYSKLTPISLKDNNISFVLKEGVDTFLEFDPEYKISKSFQVLVQKDGHTIDNFDVLGCKIDQPFSFTGFSIPGFNKRIALHVSTSHGNCFEGGYSYDYVKSISGLSNIDKTPVFLDGKYENILGSEWGSHSIYISDNSMIVYEESVNISISEKENEAARLALEEKRKEQQERVREVENSQEEFEITDVEDSNCDIDEVQIVEEDEGGNTLILVIIVSLLTLLIHVILLKKKLKDPIVESFEE